MDPQRTTIERDTLLLRLQLGRFGVSRGVDPTLYEVEADKRLTTLTKRILDDPSLRAIARFDTATVSQIRHPRNSLPTTIFGDGSYIVRTDRVRMLSDWLDDRAIERGDLVAVARRAYPDMVTQAVTRLGALAITRDYPNADVFASAYTMRWTWYKLEAPVDLASIDEALYERELGRIKSMVDAAYDEIRDNMTVLFQRLLGEVTERLTPSDDGKPKIMRAGKIKSLKEFVEVFDVGQARNADELARLVAATKAALEGVEAEELATIKATDLRASVAAALGPVQQAAEQLAVGGARVIELPD